MLIKVKDPSDKAIQALEKISQIPDLSEDTLANVERELKTLKAGNRGEQDSAYYIDFYYKDHRNWVILHDLRIEYGGNVAQIDHLLINRLLEFYILETKSYAYGVKITDRGEFLFWHKNRYIAFPSPIEQNNRHVIVLEKLLKGENLLPKRLGMHLQPLFKPYVLVSPNSNVIRPDKSKFKTDLVIKSDELFNQIQKDADTANTVEILGGLAKLISTDALMEFAQQLVAYHKPATIDYYAKFGVKSEPDAPIQPNTDLLKEKTYFCAKCKKPISQKIALFCFQNKKRFGGKAYCYDCQKAI